MSLSLRHIHPQKRYLAYYAISHLLKYQDLFLRHRRHRCHRRHHRLFG